MQQTGVGSTGNLRVAARLMNLAKHGKKQLTTVTTSVSAEARRQLLLLGESSPAADFLKSVGKQAATAAAYALFGEEAAALAFETAKDFAQEMLEQGNDYTRESREIEAVFMGEIFKIPDIGLGGFGADTLKPGDGVLNAFFSNALVRTYLYAYGQSLVQQVHDYGVVPIQWVSLTIHEVSYCDQGADTDCGPGYLAKHGIKSYLEFSFKSSWQLLREGPLHAGYGFEFVTPYYAQNWLKAMQTK